MELGVLRPRTFESHIRPTQSLKLQLYDRLAVQTTMADAADPVLQLLAS